MSSGNQGTEKTRRKVGWGAWVGVGVVALLVGVLATFLISNQKAGDRVAKARAKLEEMGYSMDPASMNREVDPAVNGWEFGKSALMSSPDTDTVGNWYLLTRGNTPLSTYAPPELIGILSPDADDVSSLPVESIAVPGPPGAPGGHVPQATPGAVQPTEPAAEEGAPNPVVLPHQFGSLTRAGYETALANLTKSADILAKAIRLPDWYIPRNYSRPSVVLFPEFAEMKSWCKIYCHLGADHFRNGEIEQGLEDFESAYLIGDKAGLERNMIGALTQAACLAIVRQQVLLTLHELSSEERIKAIPGARKLIANHKALDVASAMHGEVMFMIEAPDLLTGLIEYDSDWWVEFAPINRNRIIAETYEDLILQAELSQKSAEDPYAGFRESKVTQPVASQGWSFEQVFREQMSPLYPELFRVPVRIFDQDRLALIALAIWEREARTGRPVGGLDELEGVDVQDLLNPSGGSYQFRREGDGFVLWGFGLDEVDQGGVIDETLPGWREDMVFQTASRDSALFISK